jgi:hypothetical protein
VVGGLGASALRLAQEAAAAVDARIAVTEGDGEVYKGLVAWLEYLDEHVAQVPIEAQEAALERCDPPRPAGVMCGNV